MKRIAIMLLLAGFSLPSWGSGEDLVNCRWKDGRQMKDIDCQEERRYQAKLAANENASQQKRDAVLQQQRQAREEQARQAAEKQAAIDVEDRARQAELAKEHAEDQAYRDNLEKQEAQAEANKKKLCGRDFMALRIGMTFDRFEKCYEALSFITETTSKNGRVESYYSTFYIIQFSNDKIVAFSRRRS